MGGVGLGQEASVRLNLRDYILIGLCVLFIFCAPHLVGWWVMGK